MHQQVFYWNVRTCHHGRVWHRRESANWRVISRCRQPMVLERRISMARRSALTSKTRPHSRPFATESDTWAGIQEDTREPEVYIPIQDTRGGISSHVRKTEQLLWVGTVPSFGISCQATPMNRGKKGKRGEERPESDTQLLHSFQFITWTPCSSIQPTWEPPKKLSH